MPSHVGRVCGCLFRGEVDACSEGDVDACSVGPPRGNLGSATDTPSVPHPLYTTPLLYHTPFVSVDRMRDGCKNITFRHTSYAVGSSTSKTRNISVW